MADQSTEVTKLDDKEVALLWNNYKTDGDQEAKNELLIHYIDLVKRIVRRMMPKYNNYNEYDDLVNCGVIGLIDAMERFDLRQGVKFETYAVTRIRGEILDYMRSQDWAPSSLRKKISAITSTYDQLESENGSPPTEAEVAEHMDIPQVQVQNALAKTHIFNLVNFEDTLSSCYVAGETPSCAESEMPENALIDKDMKQILAQLIDSLPEKERLVITLYYYEELMLKEIAEIMGVSESRISQIHSKVLLKMRAKLDLS